MTNLREDDQNLHYPDGSHLIPADAEIHKFTGRLRRHLAAHELADARAAAIEGAAVTPDDLLAELAELGAERTRRHEALTAALAGVAANREEIVARLRQGASVGVTQGAMAEAVGVNRRTVIEFIRDGKAVR